MWGSLVVGLLTRPLAWRVAGVGLVALNIAMFILNLRCLGERAGRTAVTNPMVRAILTAIRRLRAPHLCA